MERAHLKKKFVFLLVMVMLLLIMSLLGPFIVPNDPYKNDAKLIRLPPSQTYIMGTDNYGRCVFSRVIMGARTSIGASLILVGTTFMVGTFIGLLCGYYGGFLDNLIMIF